MLLQMGGSISVCKAFHRFAAIGLWAPVYPDAVSRKSTTLISVNILISFAAAAATTTAATAAAATTIEHACPRCANSGSACARRP